MRNRNAISLTICLLILVLATIGCGPGTPPPIVPVDGTWTGVNDPVMVSVSDGVVTSILWTAGEMVYVNSQYEMMQVSCELEGSIPIQADGSFTFNGTGVVGHGVFTSPTTGHVFATFTSCTARPQNFALGTFPAAVKIEETITSDADIEPLK